MEEGLAKFQNNKLRFEPGTDYLYSSYGYNLLGIAMEKATQRSFEELLTTYVTRPLGMEHTLPDPAEYEALETSGFFIYKGGQAREAKSVDLRLKLPSGGMLSTSEDLVRLGNAYTYQRILAPATQEEWMANTPLPNGKKPGYGLGWGVSPDPKGRPRLSHTGGNTGAICKLIVYPEQRVTVALVSNTSDVDWLRVVGEASTISNEVLAELGR